MNFKEALTFDDVLIVPQYSEVLSRFDPDTKSELLEIDIPIISANMDSVTGPRMAVAMEKAGGLGVLHRFSSRDIMLENTNIIDQANVKNVAVSIGIGDPGKVVDWAVELVAAGAHTIVVDVAHGDQRRVYHCISALREKFAEGVTIIAGNIATYQAANRMYDAGAHMVKVGIGPGAACTTRETTGVGYPQFSAIYDMCHDENGSLLDWQIPIIADGGIKNTGDFCKAIAAGAEAVMMGSVLAGADESNGDFDETSRFKVYRGMASKEARQSFGISKDTGYNEHIAEGVSGMVPASGPVANILDNYKKALQSSMSYVGAKNLKEYREKCQFVKVSNNSIIENGTRV